MPVTAKRDTGHGATLTLATTSWAGKIVRITGMEINREPVNVSHLGTSGQTELIAGDLETISAMTIVVGFETATGLPATTTTAETATLTFPLAPGGGGVTAATLAGTAFITRTKYPDMVTGQATEAEFNVQFDGGTGPTWTAEAAS